MGIHSSDKGIEVFRCTDLYAYECRTGLLVGFLDVLDVYQIISAISTEFDIEISDEDVENEYQQITIDYQVELEYAKSALPAEEIVHSLTMRRAVELLKNNAKVTYLDKAPEVNEEETAEDAE